MNAVNTADFFLRILHTVQTGKSFAFHCIKNFHWFIRLFWPIRFDFPIVSIGNNCNVKPDRHETLGKSKKSFIQLGTGFGGAWLNGSQSESEWVKYCYLKKIHLKGLLCLNQISSSKKNLRANPF